MPVRSPTPTDDDDLEIEVSSKPDPQPAPAPQAPQARPQARAAARRPRTPNPVADEVIHTGEIAEKPEAARSLIIRSGESSPALPKVEVREDPTEPVQMIVHTAPPEKSRKNALWLIAALVPGVAAVALTLTDKTAPPPTAGNPSIAGIEATAEMLGTTLDAEVRAAQVQAAAIATSSMLRAGIQTDPQTLADMARDKDIVFPVEHGESLEVFQLRDGARTSMLRIPAGAPSISPPPAGKARLDAHKGGIAAIAAAPVAGQDGVVTGEVAIAIPIDLEPVKKRLTGQVSAAEITGLAAPVVLAGAKPGSDKLELAIATKLVEGAALKLVATPTGAAAAAIAAAKPNDLLKIVRFACIGLAGLLLVVFALSLRRGTVSHAVR